MKEELVHALANHLSVHYPELALGLPVDITVSQYLQDRVNTVMPMAFQLLESGKKKEAVIAECLEILTEELQPSRFQYLKNILQEDFPDEYDELETNGRLKFEIINLIEKCASDFEAFGFSSETIGNNQLRHSVIFHIHNHLEI